ncbi:MAG: hypothetical protein N3G20_06235, partial [Verrucomicrobiae bacterium]|nr:hypothetical protein [Verrucomicrobiae bacterium]
MRKTAIPGEHTTSPVQFTRRNVLGVLGAGFIALTRTIGAAPLPNPTWKTAVGLNGFESASRKYKKNYPIWEILDFASRHGFDG